MYGGGGGEGRCRTVVVYGGCGGNLERLYIVVLVLGGCDGCVWWW